MAETKKSLADILIDLADNTTGNITPQDIRDSIVSLQPPFGGTSIEGNTTTTTISTTGVYEVILGTFSVSGMSEDVLGSTVGGKLTYTGLPDRHFHIVSNFDILCASNNQVLSFKWFKNGVAIGVPVKRKVGTGTDIGAVSVHADAMLSTNDYLELRVTNDTSTSSITVKNAYMFVMGMIM